MPFQEHDLAAELQGGPGVTADDTPEAGKAPADQSVGRPRTRYGKDRLRRLVAPTG